MTPPAHFLIDRDGDTWEHVGGNCYRLHGWDDYKDDRTARRHLERLFGPLVEREDVPA